MAAFMLIFRNDKPWQDSPEQMQQHMQKWMAWFDGQNEPPRSFAPPSSWHATTRSRTS